MLKQVIEWAEKIFAHQMHHSECLERVERNQEEIMAGIAELNAAIAALPQKIADDVIPLIPVPATGGGDTGGPVGDTTPQIEALAQIPSRVASMVQAAIAAGTPAPPAVTDTPPADTSGDTATE